MFPWDNVADVADQKSEDHRGLIINRVITYRVTQPIWPRYVSVADEQRTMAIPRFALRASGGKKIDKQKCNSQFSSVQFSNSILSTQVL